MTTLKEFVYCLCASALFCSVVCELLKSTSVYPLVRWISGLILLLSILKPLGNFSGLDYQQWLPVDSSLSQDWTSQGEAYSNWEKIERISDKTSSYILDMAESMGISARVEVIVSEDDIPIPVGVRIHGQTTPYLKLCLEEWIQDNLNIPKENLIWIG